MRKLWGVGVLVGTLIVVSYLVRAQVQSWNGFPPPGMTYDSSTQTLKIGGNTLAPSLTGTTGSIGGGVLLAGACSSGTVSVSGSTTSMAVEATPATYPGDGTWWYGYVSSNGTVTVHVCAVLALTPAASAYNVRVIQ